MARKEKVDNSVLKRLRLKEQRAKRKKDTKFERQYFLIVCEGEKTEPNYFKSIRSILPPHLVEVEIQGTGMNTKTLIAETRRLKSELEKKRNIPFDQTWAVFDRDSFNVDDFNGAITSAERGQPPINCAWSNEAFELWYVLHFDNLTAQIKRGGYIVRIEEILSKALDKKYEYKKNCEEMYTILQEHGNRDLAIRYAERLCKSHTGSDYEKHQPATRVYLLVKELIKYFPTDESEE